MLRAHRIVNSDIPMRTGRIAGSLALVVALSAVACDSPTGPGVALVLSAAPDFVAVVTKNSYQSGLSPAGRSYSQYDLWVALPPSDTADAGVVIGDSTPVFFENRFGLARGSAASIRAGDLVSVWHDSHVVYGSVQAPPGSPGYIGTQILVRRP